MFKRSITAVAGPVKTGSEEGTAMSTFSKGRRVASVLAAKSLIIGMSLLLGAVACAREEIECGSPGTPCVNASQQYDPPASVLDDIVNPYTSVGLESDSTVNEGVLDDIINP